jgi:hypothetical protein
MGWGSVAKLGGSGGRGGKVVYAELKKNVGSRFHLYDGEPDPNPYIRHRIKEGNGGKGVYCVCSDTHKIIKRMQTEKITQVIKAVDPKAYEMTCPECTKWFAGGGPNRDNAPKVISEIAPRLAYKHNVYDFSKNVNALLDQTMMVFQELDSKIDTLVGQGANIKDYDFVITPKDGKSFMEYDVTPISPTKFAPGMDVGQRYDIAIKPHTPAEIEKCMKGGVYWKVKGDKDAPATTAAAPAAEEQPDEVQPEAESETPPVSPEEQAPSGIDAALDAVIGFGKKEGKTLREFMSSGVTQGQAKDYVVWLRNSDSKEGRPTATAAEILLSNWDEAFEKANTVAEPASAEPAAEPEAEPATEPEPEPEPETEPKAEVKKAAKPAKAVAPKATAPAKPAATKPAATKPAAAPAKPAATAQPESKKEKADLVNKINKFFLESDTFQDPEKIIEEFTKVSKKATLHEMSIPELKQLAQNVGCKL